MIMRKHCKALAAILALFLAVSALTACGGGETAEETAAEETAV